MFSYNALISTGDGYLVLHYMNTKLRMVQSNSILKIVGSSHKYIIRPSGLAILDKDSDTQNVSPPENTDIPDDRHTLTPTDKSSDTDKESDTQNVSPPENTDIPDDRHTLTPTDKSSDTDKESDTQNVSPPENTDIPDDDNSPRTYYIQVNMTPEGRVLDTDDFGLFHNYVYTTKAMPKGTRLAVATVKMASGLWNVPGTNSMAFVPPSVKIPGNIGEMMVTNTTTGNQMPLWRLEGPPEDNYLFYTLINDLQKSALCTTG